MTITLKPAKGETNTVIPALNTAWAGQQLGNKTRGRGDRRTSGPYNIFVLAGLQPKLSGQLFCHNDSGFLQRFVFVATADTYRLADAPNIPVPTVTPSGDMPIINFGDMFTADPRVMAEVEETDGDYELDHLFDDYAEMMSHAPQVQIRIACLGALLHGTLYVSWELWEWSGWILEHSYRVFMWLDRQATELDHTLANKVATRQAVAKVSGEANVNAEVVRVAGVLLRALEKSMPDGLTTGKWKNLLGSKKGDRDTWFEKAVEYLVRQNTVYFDETTKRYKVK
jgi:hypothetical protein